MRNAFTVDVEDYYHVSAFEKHVERHRWDDYESRVVENTHRLLDILKRHGVKATFFVLGWVAEREPGLVRDIHQAGHEIGCHGYWHRLVYQSTPEEFREDLVRARDAISRVTATPVVAYRAPSFSITAKSLWALEILAEEGFRYDSSIFPVYHDRYGIPDAPRGIHCHETPAGAVWEFPISVTRVGGVNLPVSGGGYFRLYPVWGTRRLLARVNRRHGRPFVFYIHPWELDAGQPRLGVGSPLARARHYVNLARTEHKLNVLLESFEFGPMCQVVDRTVCVAAGEPSSA